MRDTSKPANENRQDKVVITQGRTSRQRKTSPSSVMIGYSDSTWAEDMAPQGCDQSADPEAGMAGRCEPPQRIEPFWRQSGKSQGFGDRVPNIEQRCPADSPLRRVVYPDCLCELQRITTRALSARHAATGLPIKTYSTGIRNGQSPMLTGSGPFWRSSTNAHCAVRFAAMSQTKAFSEESGWGSRDPYSGVSLRRSGCRFGAPAFRPALEHVPMM